MLAFIAAGVFGFALLLDLFDSDLGAPDLFNWNTLLLIGLLCLSLYLAGVGRAPGGGGGGRWYGAGGRVGADPSADANRPGIGAFPAFGTGPVVSS